MTILTLRGLFPTHHGDISQLVNSRYCVIILCVLAISDVIMVSLFYPMPIECFCPSHMTGVQCKMLSSTCLKPGSEHYLPFPSEIPTLVDDRLIALSPFYQFVALLLLLQAGLFYAPYVISRELSRCSGINPDELSLAALESRRTKDVDERQTAVKDIAAHIHSFCLRQLRRRHMSYAFRWLYGMKLNLVQLLAKSLYVANVIGQFYMLDELLGFNFHSLGWTILGRKNVLTDFSHALANMTGIPDLYITETNVVQIFPLEIFCDSTTYRIGSPVHYTLHCVLPINILNEVLFDSVWFVMFSVAIVSCISLFVTFVRLVLFPCGRMTIRDRLQDFGLLNNDNLEQWKKKIDLFEREFLRMDGMMLLNYVEDGAGDVISDSTLANIWEIYNDESQGDLDSLNKPLKLKEKLVEDIYHVPTKPVHSVEETRPLTTINTPVQPEESHKTRGYNEDIKASASGYSETELHKTPRDNSSPPEYVAAMENFSKDDDFMV